MDKKGQTGGLITSLVFGVASLVIGVIIAFVIVSTLTGSGIITSVSTTQTIINESQALLGTGITVIDSNSILGFTSWNATLLLNATDSGIAGEPSNNTLIEGVDYQIFPLNGSFGNLTGGWDAAFITYDYVDVDSLAEQSAGNLSGNFTEGVNNVSEKIPTVLLVAAIVLILGVLAILVGVWQRMNMGGGAQL